jgi:molybdenum cofactor biosynthesis enzyme MoaA
MKLEEIGFYTLEDQRAQNVTGISPMWRCEMLVTGRCNFACPYCRGFETISEDCGDISPDVAKEVINIWTKDHLRNIRFSGGEPTLYPHLNELVSMCKDEGVQRIAVSTNGSRSMSMYEKLIEDGVNDFSISLDACCASFGDQMAGVNGKWETVTENIKEISKLTYVSVGIVLTSDTVKDAKDIIRFAHELGVADIRIISAAQYNELIKNLGDLESEILDAHPILKYRVQNLCNNINVRGIEEKDCSRCYVVKDDSIVVGNAKEAWHFPCVIAMREGCKSIGKVGPNMREERLRWSQDHDTYEDLICRKNCLDCLVLYNNKAKKYEDNKNI